MNQPAALPTKPQAAPTYELVEITLEQKKGNRFVLDKRRIEAIDSDYLKRSLLMLFCDDAAKVIDWLERFRRGQTYTEKRNGYMDNVTRRLTITPILNASTD